METSTGQSTPDQAKEKAQEAAGQVQQVAGQAKEQARTRVTDVVSQRSTTAGEQVNSAADALRQTSSQLRSSGKDAPAKAMDTLAERIESVGNWLRDSDGDQILHDIEDLGRRQPTAIMFGGLALGFAASRVLRASSSKRFEGRSGDGSLDRYRTTGGNASRASAGIGTTPGAPGALSGSPTSGLTAEGGTASAPTSRMGLESDVRRDESTRPGGVR